MTHVEYGLFPSYDLFAFNLEVSVPGTVEIVAMMEAICWPSELQDQSREYLIGSGARKRSLPHRNKPLWTGTCERTQVKIPGESFRESRECGSLGEIFSWSTLWAAHCLEQ